MKLIGILVAIIMSLPVVANQRPNPVQVPEKGMDLDEAIRQCERLERIKQTESQFSAEVKCSGKVIGWQEGVSGVMKFETEGSYSGVIKAKSKTSKPSPQRTVETGVQEFSCPVIHQVEYQYAPHSKKVDCDGLKTIQSQYGSVTDYCFQQINEDKVPLGDAKIIDTVKADNCEVADDGQK